MKRVKLWRLDDDFLGQDADSYTKEGRRRDVEADAMKGWEEAFLDGWDNA